MIAADDMTEDFVYSDIMIFMTVLIIEIIIKQNYIMYVY